MDISLNKDQQKSALLTTLVVGLLLLILFFVRFWPPSNLKELMGGGGGGGIEMNFCDSDFGMGENFKSETLNVKEEQSKQAPATASPEDNVITEDDAADETLAEAGTFRQLGDRPLFVLTAMAPWPEQFLAYWQITAGQAKQYQDIRKQMSEEQATWSSQSQHQLVHDADHYIQFDRPDIVIAAVRSVVEIVQAKRDATFTSLTRRSRGTAEKRGSPSTLR